MCLISGGNWNNTTNAGVWSLNLNNFRANSNNNIGFRSADYDNFANPQISEENSGVIGIYCPVLINKLKRNKLCNLLFGNDSSYNLSENQEIVFNEKNR